MRLLLLKCTPTNAVGRSTGWKGFDVRYVARIVGKNWKLKVLIVADSLLHAAQRANEIAESKDGEVVCVKMVRK